MSSDYILVCFLWVSPVLSVNTLNNPMRVGMVIIPISHMRHKAVHSFLKVMQAFLKVMQAFGHQSLRFNLGAILSVKG